MISAAPALGSSSAKSAPPTVDLILAEQDHLQRVARRLTRCDADADDLVQDTLLRAYRACARFEPGTSIRAWTTTILRRVFLTDAIRSKRRGLETDTDAGEPLDRTSGAPPVTTKDHAPTLDELGERLDDPVKRALERVPEVYRVPFYLAVIEDLTCAEIARRLGVPEGTVMSRIHRARERLKRDLVYDRRAAAAAAPQRPRIASKLRVVRDARARSRVAS